MQELAVERQAARAAMSHPKPDWRPRIAPRDEWVAEQLQKCLYGRGFIWTPKIR